VLELKEDARLTLGMEDKFISNKKPLGDHLSCTFDLVVF